ncbi:MAG: metallophosphoesterase family protein [Pirellulales bacterium]|nr:metallophosphoesterase family protein [Pirellulales bacterium]
MKKTAANRCSCPAAAIAGAMCLLAICSTAARAAAPTLQFNPQGKFKIVQLTDLHWNSTQEEAPKTLEVIEKVIDAEKPDLVVLTGDVVVTERDPLEDWTRLTEPIRRRAIPWAAVMGNHDDEKHGVARRDIVKHLAALPGSLAREGPESLGATGNYVLTIAGSKSNEAACALYFLDSQAYPTIEAINQCKDVRSRYGWVSFDQIQWYRQTSRQLRAARCGEPLPAMAFFHIPLQEYCDPILLKSKIGARGESGSHGTLNSGLFAAMLEEGDVMGVAVGHDHDNDYAGCLFGICLAYGRVSGLAAYGDLPRGGRVIELTEGKREFDSWIRPAEGPVRNRIHFPTSFENRDGG